MNEITNDKEEVPSFALSILSMRRIKRLNTLKVLYVQWGEVEEDTFGQGSEENGRGYTERRPKGML